MYSKPTQLQVPIAHARNERNTNVYTTALAVEILKFKPTTNEESLQFSSVALYLTSAAYPDSLANRWNKQ